MATIFDLLENSDLPQIIIDIFVFIIVVVLSYVVINLLLSMDKIKIEDRYRNFLSFISSISLGILAVNHLKTSKVLSLFVPFYSYIIIVIVLGLAIAKFVSDIMGENNLKNIVSYVIIGIVVAIMVLSISINYMISEFTKKELISPATAALIIYAVIGGMIIAIGRGKV